MALAETASGEYKAKPPWDPEEGHWTAYYIEMKFASGTTAKTQFHVSTPGYVWPATLPFKDCHGDSCIAPNIPPAVDAAR